MKLAFALASLTLACIATPSLAVAGDMGPAVILVEEMAGVAERNTKCEKQGPLLESFLADQTTRIKRVSVKAWDSKVEPIDKDKRQFVEALHRLGVAVTGCEASETAVGEVLALVMTPTGPPPAEEETADPDGTTTAGSKGTLDKTIIRRVVKKHTKTVKACYEKELNKDGKLAGKLVAKWTINTDGSVAKAEITQDSMGNEKVAKCLTKAIGTWTFPKPKGGIVLVSYPFKFDTSK